MIPVLQPAAQRVQVNLILRDRVLTGPSRRKWGQRCTKEAKSNDNVE